MDSDSTAPSVRLRLLQALRRLSLAAPQLRADRKRRGRRRRAVLVSVAAIASIGLNLLLLFSLRGLWSGADTEEGDGIEAVEVFVPEPPAPTLDSSARPSEVPTTPLPASLEAFDEPLQATSLASEAPLAIAPLSSAGISCPALDSSGTGGTTFFGVSARGRRIGYVVDVSASMESGGRLWLALGELKRSLAGLPDYAWFYVALFSGEVIVPPFQRSWQRAVPGELARIEAWIDRDVSTGGGTRPGPAFERLFSLDPKPDAIFFLTDGEVPADTPALVRRLNDRIRPTVINTVAFGTEAGRTALEEIARDSDGIFRFVPTGPRR
jgi:hypothetical protein